MVINETGKCVVIVGNTGTGKTTLLKKIIDNSQQLKFIYDVNNEYSCIGAKKEVSFKDFLMEATKKRNTLICFEEATIFFRHAKNSEEILNLLVRKRHTQNNIILNFHAIHQIPLFVFDFVNFLILKKTNDHEKNIQKFLEREDFAEAYEDVKNSTNNFYFEILKLN